MMAQYHMSTIIGTLSHISTLLFSFCVFGIFSSPSGFSNIESTSCEFPSSWRGLWYQSGLGEVSINHERFTTKGSCAARQRDFFMLEDSEQNCFRCLILMRRHSNILQYKESFCLPVRDLRYTCDQIRVELPLYTLVRVHHRVTPCPWSGAMSIAYNNNTLGTCDNGLSYVSTCASRAHQSFHFHGCNQLPYTFNSVRELECIAKWKAGSDHFLYGSFVDKEDSSRSQRYRCFKYKVLGPVVQLSMSADATCQGLTSTQDGPLVMRLTEGATRSRPRLCEFPAWLSNVQWNSLSGRQSYTLSADRTTLNAAYRQEPYKTHRRHSYECVQLEETGRLGNEISIKTHVQRGCDSTYECIKIIRPVNHLIHLVKGRRLVDENDLCSTTSYYANNHAITLSGTPPDSLVDCPLYGSYTLAQFDGVPRCDIVIQSGCQNRSTIRLASTCNQQAKEYHLYCEYSWQARNTDNYIIVKEQEHMGSTANILRYTTMANITSIIIDSQYNRGTSSFLPFNRTYTFIKTSDTCPSMPMTASTSPSPTSPTSLQSSTTAQQARPFTWFSNDINDILSHDDISGQTHSRNNHSTKRTTISNFIYPTILSYSQTDTGQPSAGAPTGTSMHHLSRTVIVIWSIYYLVIR